MKVNRRIATRLLLGVAATGLGACEYLLGKSWLFRQKLTITLSTPAGEVSGSSVTQWKLEKGPGIFYSLGGMGSWQAGEATVVEVAPGKSLFALLGKPHPVAGLFGSSLGDSLEDELDRIVSEKIKSIVPNDEYPMLVTFAHINDPKSVKMVDPANLAASFGSGYSLKSITLEVTDEPLTEGIVEDLAKWLVALNGKYLHGGSTSKGSPLGLHGGNFKSGYPK